MLSYKKKYYYYYIVSRPIEKVVPLKTEASVGRIIDWTNCSVHVDGFKYNVTYAFDWWLRSLIYKNTDTR